MHCLGKEYRVVCSKTPEKSVIIDIVPAESNLHQLVLKELQKRNSETKLIAGSISLYDMGEGNRPEILFLPSERGGLEYEELLAAEENKLRYMITRKFNDMMAQNINSTIVVRPEINQEYVNGFISNVARQLEVVRNSVDAPKSITEERNRLQEQQRLRKEKTREQTNSYLEKRDAKYSKYKLTALQIKQLLHRDY